MFDRKNLCESLWKSVVLALSIIAVGSPSAWATNSIKANFLTAYPSAAGSRLATLPSAPNHCGACHYAFSSSDADGGDLNPYGNAIADNGKDSDEILAIGSRDSDGDGFSNNAEIQGMGFTNIPTFPGLKPSNVSNVSGVTLSEINGFLVPVASAADCNNDADCTDTLFCTGVETCVAGECVDGTGDPCEAGEICNEGSNTCDVAPECTGDADCTDTLFCSGVETCVAGECVDGPGDPCEVGEICNEGSNTCDVAPACTINDNCTDTLFCTGVETCVAGECVAGTDPCTGATPECVEETETCVECLNDADCAVDEICEENLCIPDTDCNPELDGIDLDGNCLLSKEELKRYNDFIKGSQKVEKDLLKTKHTAEKNYSKYLKETYAE